MYVNLTKRTLRWLLPLDNIYDVSIMQNEVIIAYNWKSYSVTIPVRRKIVCSGKDAAVTLK